MDLDFMMMGGGGSGGSRRVTRPRRRRPTRAKAKTGAVIPAFPNAFPYNELLLDGKLIAKTRSWIWAHRGLTLLYTSTKSHGDVARAHEMRPESYPRKAIVGVGYLVDVRPLTKREKRKLFSQFNNVPNRRAVSNRALRKHGIWVSSDVYPLPIGFFFEGLRRFEEPVPFDWPSGPVKPIGVPVSKVAAALKAVGIREIDGIRI